MIRCSIILVFFLSVFYIPSIAQSTEKSQLHLKGTINNDLIPCKILISKEIFTPKKSVYLDSIEMKDVNKFEFNFNELDPGYYRIYCRGEKRRTSGLLLIDSGVYKAKVVFDTASFQTKDGRMPLVNLSVEGLPDNVLLDGFYKIRRHYYTELIFPIEDEIRKNSRIDPERLSELNSKLNGYKIEMNRQLKDFILNKMGTSIAIYQTMSVWDNSDLPFMEEIMERFRKSKSHSFILPVMESKYASLVNTSLLGKKAPSFSLEDMNGNVIDLESMKGKKILLDFWASWCGPCIKDMKGIMESYDKIKGHIIIISISVDKTREAWQRALNKYKFPWINLVDDPQTDSTYKSYGIVELPTNFLIDEKGNIIKKGVTLYDLLKLSGAG